MTDINLVAEFLLDHRASKETVDNIPESIYPQSEEEAYLVQDRVVARLTESNESTTCGYKLACTNPRIMAHLGVPGPLSGRLMTHSMYEDGMEFDAEDFVLRIIEQEFMLVMGQDVPDTGQEYTAESILPFIDGFHPAIEVVDHRYNDFTLVGANALIADNAIHACSVLGTAGTESWRNVDLADHAVTLFVNDEATSTGSGSNVLGGPLNAVAWLANHLISRDRTLVAGDIITTGAACDVYPAVAGDRIHADFGDLGSVSISFS